MVSMSNNSGKRLLLVTSFAFHCIVCRKKTTFTGMNEVYYGNADSVRQVLSISERLQFSFGEPDALPLNIFVTVIGSWASINMLLYLQPKHIIFFDLNAYSVQYMKTLLGILSISESRVDFLEMFYGRELTEDAVENLNQNSNPTQWLLSPQNQSIISETSKMLELSGVNLEMYLFLQTRIMPTPLTDNISHSDRKFCERILPVHDPSKNPALNPNMGKGINTCTLYWGHGWLSSDEAFQKVRSRLENAKKSFATFNIFEESLRHLFTVPLTDLNVMYTSNILTPHFAKFEDFEILSHRLRQIMATSGALLALCGLQKQTSRLNVPGVLFYGPYASGEACPQHFRRGSPHAQAWKAVSRFVPRNASVLEVTNRVPWGFYELQNRMNILVEDCAVYFSSAEALYPVIILHIIVGEGGQLYHLESCLNTAFRYSKRILILEHNKEATDFKSSNVPGMFNSTTLPNFVKSLMPDGKFFISHLCVVPSNHARNRNLLLVVERLPALDV